MKRRDFITKAVPAAAGGALLAGCSASTQGPAVVTNPRVMWRMASSYPRSLDILYGAAEHLAERVSVLTEGRFTIRVYPAGEIVPGNQVMDAVQQGTVQCGQTASYYYTGKHDALAFDTSVPFGLTARQQAAWLLHAGGLDLINGILADFNIVTRPMGSTGAQMGGWFRNPIRSVNDLKGLKIRIPGLGGEVMNRMGATVQLLTGAEVYMALERGAIDAVEWVGPYDDEKLGFHRIIKNYSYPGWWEPGPTISNYIHRPSLEKLPAAYREALITATDETAQWMTANYDAKNPAALQRLLDAGVILNRFPDDLMEQAQEISEALMREKSAADASYRRVFEPWNRFREASNRWFATAELTYLERSLKPFAG